MIEFSFNIWEIRMFMLMVSWLKILVNFFRDVGVIFIKYNGVVLEFIFKVFVWILKKKSMYMVVIDII